MRAHNLKTVIVAIYQLCLVNISVVPMREGGVLVGGNIVADFADAINLGSGHGAIMALGGVLTVLAENASERIKYSLDWVLL